MVEIEPLPPAQRLILWGDSEIAARAGAALGLALPHRPNSATENGPRAALWLGPGEWLLLLPEGDTLNLPAAPPHSLVDVSDGFVALLLRGPGAALALSAGCPLDLHPSAFPPGMATRTVLGRAGITLWRCGAEEWRLEIPRSLTAYARDFLAEAARGLPDF